PFKSNLIKRNIESQRVVIVHMSVVHIAQVQYVGIGPVRPSDHPAPSLTVRSRISRQVIHSGYLQQVALIMAFHSGVANLLIFSVNNDDGTGGGLNLPRLPFRADPGGRVVACPCEQMIAISSDP